MFNKFIHRPVLAIVIYRDHVHGRPWPLETLPHPSFLLSHRPMVMVRRPIPEPAPKRLRSR